MAGQSTTSDPASEAQPYRVLGSLTISRAATTQREIEALADPVTIDLSGVEKVDTVGAWLIYRTVRDRGAKVIGASKDVASRSQRRRESRHGRGLADLPDSPRPWSQGNRRKQGRGQPA